MKNKKKAGIRIFCVICAVIVVVCLIVQFVFRQESKELEKKSEKLETLVTETKSGAEVETEYVKFEDSKFLIKIPTAFQPLDAEILTQKYSGDIPDVVLSNTETTINVAVSFTDNEMSNDQIESYKAAMENLLKDSSQILSSDFYEVDNHNVGKIELISTAQDTSIYNNMIFFSYNEKLVIVTFNCTVELQDEWQNVGDFIIDSLFFKE